MPEQEAVFQKFTAAQAANYAVGRGHSYPESLYESILSFHHGGRNTAMDVGTGPGKVAWDLLKHFDYVIGCDAGPGMIEHAKNDAANFKVSDRTTFTVANAESCASAVAEAGRSSVDLITVATAAHWFDLPHFYESAAQALRPGGTLAMWIQSSFYIHPSVPNAKAIQAVLSDLEDNTLRPYYQPGSLHARTGYDNLPLPWTPPSDGLGFDEHSFQRVLWDRDGIPSAPPLPDGTPGPFQLTRGVTLEQAERGLGTSSAIIRWREANPDKAGTDEDVVKMMMARVRAITGDMDQLTVAPSCTLLLMRRV